MNQKENSSHFKWTSFIPLFVIIIFMIISYFLGLFDAASFDAIKANRDQIQNFVQTHKVTSPFIFIALYAIFVALSLPGAIFFTLIGGFIFPFPLSALYVVIGATLGAIGIFLAAKTSIGAYLRKKFGKSLEKLHRGFEKNAMSYLLFLRFVPIFPFWLVNIASSLFNIKLFTFTWTTFVGIIPGSLVFTYAASSINSIFDESSAFSIEHIFTLKIKIALALLGVFALLPIFLKRFKRDR